LPVVRSPSLRSVESLSASDRSFFRLCQVEYPKAPFGIFRTSASFLLSPPIRELIDASSSLSFIQSSSDPISEVSTFDSEMLLEVVCESSTLEERSSTPSTPGESTVKPGESERR